MKYLSLVFLFLFLVVPDSVSAQGGLVTCSGIDCNFCTFAEMVNGIVQWIVAIMTLIAVMLMVYAGFKIVTSAGDTSAVQDAKGMLVNVVIGFIIVLAAWTIVDTLIKALVSDDASFGVWNPTTCGAITEPSDLEFYYGEDAENEVDSVQRAKIIEENPNVVRTFSGSMGTAEQKDFSFRCIEDGYTPAYDTNAQRLECRTD